MKKLLFGLPTALSLTVCAEVVEVSESAKAVFSAESTVRAMSEKLTDVFSVSSWPEDVPMPIYWFDCSVTNGWTIETAEDGSRLVTRIPSLVGGEAAQFLTTDVTLEGTTWTGWNADASKDNPIPPVLIDDTSVSGSLALDFGAMGSSRALVFSPADVGSGVKRSGLHDVGTMIVVLGSQNGGGYLMGGYNDGAKGDYRFERGNITGLCTETVMHGNTGTSGDTLGAPGFLMRDGSLIAGESICMSGGWETYGLVPSNRLDTVGIGVNDTRAGYKSRSGGQRIVETMYFSEALTAAQVRRIELYLNHKWFGKWPKGVNGTSRLGRLYLHEWEGTFSSTVDVPEGEKLEISELKGGRAGGAYGSTVVEKTGAGILEIKDASSFTAPIRLNGGTLAFDAKRKIPKTAAELPSGMYLRFDASEKESLAVSEKDGRMRVDHLADLAGGTIGGKSVYLKARTDFTTWKEGDGDFRPYLNDWPFGSELPIVDCGIRDVYGKFLCFFSGDSAESSTRQSIQACTMIGLYCLENGGGHPANGAYLRENNWIGAGSWSSPVLSYSSSRRYGQSKINVASNSTVFVDGMRIGPQDAFRSRGGQVVAYRVPAGGISTIGASQYYAGIADGSPHGGTMFGELIFYQRPLTDEEMLDVQAYLAKKWLNKIIPGYSDDDHAGIADVQELEVVGDAAIDVADGRTALVRSLKLARPIEKRGGGTLAVGPGSDVSGIVLREGSVKSIAYAPNVSGDCCPAPGASLHLDASKLDSIVTKVRNGTNFVSRWYSSVGGRHAESNEDLTMPWLNSEEDAKLNGHPVVDFGEFVDKNSGTRMWLSLPDSLCSVRSAFIVRGSQAGGGTLLGEKYNTPERNAIDFYRGESATVNDPIIRNPTPHVRDGKFYLDGVETNCTKALPTGGYELIDIHPAAGALVSALAAARGTDNFGGQRLAEVIIYERPLSEREIVATRNYLVKKWFPGRSLQELPADDQVAGTVNVFEVAVDGDRKMEVTTPVAVDRITGDAKLEKTGSGNLAVKDMSYFGGIVDVGEGVLTLTGAQSAVEPVLKEEGRIVHFDANYGIQAVTNKDHTVTVTNWVSRAGGGWSAECAKTTPNFLFARLNGMPIVDLDELDRMKFRKDGVYTSIAECGSVFWVFGSQRGGGFLLGGGTQDAADNGKKAYYPWHRGGGESVGRGAKNYGHPIFSGSGYDNVGNGSWRVNAQSVKASASNTLSGGWDVISWRAKTAETTAPAAGFAFDGRDYRFGCQALAEVIIYDHLLSDEEMAQVEAYLQRKWGFAQNSSVNNAEVTVAEGAKLVAVGGQYIGTLCGEGSIEGNVTVGGMIAEYGGSGLTVDGTLTLADGAVISVKGVEGPVRDEIEIPLAEAAGVQGDLSSVVFTGVPGDTPVRLRFREGVLSVCIGRRGFFMKVK